MSTRLGTSIHARAAAYTLASVLLFGSLGVRGAWGAEEKFSLMDHLTLSASDRMRGEFVSWFDPAGPKSDNGYSFFANRLRFGATLNFPTVEVFVEGQDTRLVNLPDSRSAAPGVGTLGPGAVYYANTRDRDQGEVALHRAYATIRQFGLPGVAVRVGRLGYAHGMEKPPQDATLAWLQNARVSQRLVGNFDYTHVGRSFDGVQVMYDRGPFNLTGLVSHPTFGGFNVNANKQIEDIDLIIATGSLVEPDKVPLSAQLFYIYYRDQRDLVAADNRQKAPATGASCPAGGNTGLIRSCDGDNIAVSTIGANLTHVVKLGPGKIDLLGWVAGQAGDWESLNHVAWASAVEAGYQLPEVPTQPWLRVGFARSSGDSDPTDDEHETFFQVLPTARAYAYFPFFNLMNNQDLFGQLLLKPIAGGSIGITGHWLRKTESDDLWYSGGGATSNTFFGFGGIPDGGIPTSSHNDLAYLTDIEVGYKVNKYLSVYGYYGHAFGQGVVSSNFAGSDADYGYIETTVAF